MDYGPMLDTVMLGLGRPVTYAVAGRQPRTMTGVMIRMAVAPEDGAEGTGALVPMRDVLRLRRADFPDAAPPVQGAIIRIDGERYAMTDVLTDPRGWFDCPLTAAPD